MRPKVTIMLWIQAFCHQQFPVRTEKWSIKFKPKPKLDFSLETKKILLKCQWSCKISILTFSIKCLTEQSFVSEKAVEFPREVVLAADCNSKKHFWLFCVALMKKKTNIIRSEIRCKKKHNLRIVRILTANVHYLYM